jgi:hypothetical protein
MRQLLPLFVAFIALGLIVMGYKLGQADGSLKGWRAAYMSGFEDARKRYHLSREVESAAVQWPSQWEGCFDGADLPEGSEVHLQGDGRILATFKVKAASAPKK